MHKSPQTTNLPEQACREGFAANAITRDNLLKKMKIPPNTRQRITKQERAAAALSGRRSDLNLQHIRAVRATRLRLQKYPLTHLLRQHRSGCLAATAADSCTHCTRRCCGCSYQPGGLLAAPSSARAACLRLQRYLLTHLLRQHRSGCPAATAACMLAAAEAPGDAPTVLAPLGPPACCRG